MENYRNFTVTDAFGSKCDVEFRWQQNAISIRHADAVDVKFEVKSGAVVEEKVIALPHPFLLKLSTENGRVLSDPWVSRLAAAHLKSMLETGEDVENGAKRRCVSTGPRPIGNLGDAIGLGVKKSRGARLVASH